MKTLPLILAMILPSLALGASTGNVPDPTEELKVMTERLKLSESQQRAIAPILANEAKKRQAIERNTTLSAKQKHDQEGVVHRAALQQIKTHFTAAQLAQINDDMNHHGTSSTNPSTKTTTAGK